MCMSLGFSGYQKTAYANSVCRLPPLPFVYLQREEHWDNVKVHLEGSNFCDPIGHLHPHRVIAASDSLLMVEDPSLVDVFLGEGVCRLCTRALQV